MDCDISLLMERRDLGKLSVQRCSQYYFVIEEHRFTKITCILHAFEQYARYSFCCF